jgi:hypothetical protein
MESALVDSARANRRETVLKKAGIIVTASVAGLLAVSPLAFASPSDKGHDRGGDSVEVTQVEADSHDCVTAQDGRTTANANAVLNLIGGIAVGIPVQALNCNQILNNVHVLSPQIGDNEVG